MNSEDYFELGKSIWQTYVPKSGQSLTVQGELLRANEKLRDESLRNGNINWDDGHEILANFILDTLVNSSDISEDQKKQLRLDIDEVIDHESPITEDEVFDRIEQTLLTWCSIHTEPIPREPNLKLLR